jgi:hypothetical protein
MGKKRNPYRILVGETERKRAVGRTRGMWVDNIKRDFREIEWDCMDWIEQAHDRDHGWAFLDTVMNLRFP